GDASVRRAAHGRLPQPDPPLGGDVMVADASTGTADARYRDAVRWMNRGCAFMERGDPASLDEALTCYARAISLLRTLPLAEHPSWANSLGAALMNQGQLLHRRHGL